MNATHLLFTETEIRSALDPQTDAAYLLASWTFTGRVQVNEQGWSAECSDGEYLTLSIPPEHAGSLPGIND